VAFVATVTLTIALFGAALGDVGALTNVTK
jgi:hypothetical protein